MDDEHAIKTVVEQPSADEWRLVLDYRRCTPRRRELLLAIAHHLGNPPVGGTDADVIAIRQTSSTGQNGR
jgi:hypothetical protein